MRVLSNAPYQVGDRLWVKETWKAYEDERGCLYYLYKDGEKKSGISKRVLQNLAHYSNKWNSPRFMFKDVARIWLEVTGVRAERLADISEEDAKAEGVEQIGSEYRNYQYKKEGGAMTLISAYESYITLWELINGKKYPFYSNPFCWVYEFKLRS